MRLFNTLSRSIEDFKPLDPPKVSLYTCGPTVYDHVHIGNLRTYIFEDTLRRALKVAGYNVQHVMNITDIDDKTIARSKQLYPDKPAFEALKSLASQYESIFYDDAKRVGIDLEGSRIIRATESIRDMQELILKIPNKYITEDGVYFDITKYPDYGKLVKLDQSHTHHRIQNDEYDKDHVADFALWKSKKEGEPSWDFEIDGRNLAGRPGWHIECSAMSTKYLGQPFDIHTGGIDLLFPHHENEIAQSQSATGKPLAHFFVHDEHLLVEGRKMSKSLNNFYILDDVTKRDFDPLAFRLLMLQAHYRSPLNFTWESLQAAQQRLTSYRAFADLRFQLKNSRAQTSAKIDYNQYVKSLKLALENDLATPKALAIIDDFIDKHNFPLEASEQPNFEQLLKFIDDTLGLKLLDSKDIDDQQKQLIAQREAARTQQDWTKADELRSQLQSDSIEINDTPYGPVWARN